MKSVVELSILGKRLLVKSEEDSDYVRSVESYLTRKIEEVRVGSKAVATLDLALLAALNVTGELMKVRDKLEGIEKKSGELNQLIDRRLP
ncbi:MAG: cell division protein ZapA [Deltaproteobacteria bacterium]|nr:cell division protein ZapA [Deltaproteobacteria bacterium]